MPELLKLASKKDVPAGGSRIVRAKDKEIALFNVNGAIHALDNVCPHRGGPIGEGPIEGTVVTCPWHGWQFDVTTGASPTVPNAKATCFKVQIQGDDVFIEI